MLTLVVIGSVPIFRTMGHCSENEAGDWGLVPPSFVHLRVVSKCAFLTLIKIHSLYFYGI